MRITVVGLGKLGLPLSAFYLSRGHQVTGVDASQERLAAIHAMEDLGDEPGLLETLRTARAEGRWRTTGATAGGVSDAEVVIVIVPVHATSEHDVEFAMLDSAAEQIGRGLGAGTLVVLESTVPVGTTRTRVLSRLRSTSGQVAFDLAYSPERVSIGSVFRDLRTYPKIVGGVGSHAGERAERFYQHELGLRTMMMDNAETAEFVKLIETSYRDANIALANSFARAADTLEIDIMQAIQAANSQPYSHIHSPGVGVGGNCIPVYPYLYAASAPVGTELSLAARHINDGMATYAVERVTAAIGDLAGMRILVLGVTYRPGVLETTNSSALLLRDALRVRGAIVLGADPLLSPSGLTEVGFEPAQPPRYAAADVVILQSPAPEFLDLSWVRATGCKLVLDGRNALERVAVERLGARYLAIGR